jgi:hypothetical protein
MGRSKVTEPEVDPYDEFDKMPIEFLEVACAIIEDLVRVYRMSPGLAFLASACMIKRLMKNASHYKEIGEEYRHEAVYAQKGFTKYSDYCRIYAEYVAEPCDCLPCKIARVSGQMAMRAYGYDPCGSNTK